MNNHLPNSEDFSEEGLDKIAPKLAAIKKGLNEGQSQNPFVTPDGYFDALGAEVMKKIESRPDFESVSSENPFQVPAGYFDSLPTIIQQRIIDQEAGKSAVNVWISGLFARPAFKYSLALASIALVVLFSTLYFTRTVSVEFAEQQVPESEQLDAVYLQQLDESDLADAYAQESTVESNTHEEGIENYLLDNDIDLNSIADQL